MKGSAVAHPNVALVKYWGKRNVPGNLPATGSLVSHAGAVKHPHYGGASSKSSSRMS